MDLILSEIHLHTNFLQKSNTFWLKYFIRIYFELYIYIFFQIIRKIEGTLVKVKELYIIYPVTN